MRFWGVLRQLWYHAHHEFMGRVLLNPTIEDMYRTGHTMAQDGEIRELFPASLPYEDGEGLYRVVRAAKARETLEIGMAYGVSTLFICQALEDENGTNAGTHHICIDPYQETWFKSIGCLNIQRAGFDSRCTVYNAASYLVMPQLIAEGVRRDMIFIDGNHRFEHTLVDYFFAERMLRPGGLLVLHDLWMPPIRKAISFILRNRADVFTLAPEFLGPPRSGPGLVIAATKEVLRRPRELRTQSAFIRHAFYNYGVFRKTADVDEEEVSLAWSDFVDF